MAGKEKDMLEDLIRNGDCSKNSTVRKFMEVQQDVWTSSKSGIERYNLDYTEQYYVRIRCEETNNHNAVWFFELFQEGQTNCAWRLNISDIIYEREKEALKGMYQNGSDIPIELFKDMTVNQFREMFDGFDKEKEDNNGSN